MDDRSRGFRLNGEAPIPWGTRFDTLVRDFEGSGYASREIACASAYGFATRYAELTAPHPDRPVMSVAYELAGTDMRSRDVLAALVIRLGAPERIDRDELSPHADSPDHVVLHAQWAIRDSCSISLSLYGAPRASPFGDGIGKLYLGWADLEAAAAPWMPAWHTANESLARDAIAPGEVRRFTVMYDVCTSNRAASHRVASLCLYTPELLDTPAPLAASLGDKGFALWSDASGARWYLSSADVSVLLGGPSTSTIRVANIAPARGGGSATIDAASWWVRCAWNSRSIDAAVRDLERVPGVTIERYAGHDA